MPTHYTEIRRTYDSPYRSAAFDLTTLGYKANPTSSVTILVKLAADTRAGLKAAVDEMKTALASDPDVSTYTVMAVDGVRIGHGMAMMRPAFTANDLIGLGTANIGPPIAYGTTNVRSVWLPTVKGNGDYHTESDPSDAAVFSGVLQHRRFQVLEAVFRVQAEATGTLDLSGEAGAGKVNNATWNGLAARHVYYEGIANFTGYDPPGNEHYWKRWHVFVYRRWVGDGPKKVNPHDEVYVDETGKIRVSQADPAAIYNPFT